MIYLRRKKTPKILLIYPMNATRRVPILRVASAWCWRLELETKFYTITEAPTKAFSCTAQPVQLSRTSQSLVSSSTVDAMRWYSLSCVTRCRRRGVLSSQILQQSSHRARHNLTKLSISCRHPSPHHTLRWLIDRDTPTRSIFSFYFNHHITKDYSYSWWKRIRIWMLH